MINTISTSYLTHAAIAPDHFGIQPGETLQQLTQNCQDEGGQKK